ncbi:37935_t:CDS:1, partial [Gigaspora margarita]
KKIILSLNRPSWEEIDNTMDNLNRILDSFKEGILFVAKQNIPSKRILSSQENSRMSPKAHRTDLHQDTIFLKKYIDTAQITEWHNFLKDK